MELKRKWQSFYHRLARWRTHQFTQLTEGLNLRFEILRLLQQAEKELTIVDLAAEPIFGEEEFFDLLDEQLCRYPELQVKMLLFAGKTGQVLLEKIKANLAAAVCFDILSASGGKMALYSLTEEPFGLFYLSEQELLLKDVQRIATQAISLKFPAGSIFERDCRNYVQFLLQNPSLATPIFPCSEE